MSRPESSKDRRFFELISPDINIDFVGRQKLWVRIALAMVVASILMPIVNVLLPSRGAPAELRCGLPGRH
jgi:hypothetical protein